MIDGPRVYGPPLIEGRPITTPMRNPEFIYKIATRDVAAASHAAGSFTGMPIDVTDGYLHFSTAGQLGETLRLWFKGQGDVVVMAVRTDGIGTNLAWEPSRGGQLFPHLYGTLPMSAVAHEATIAVDANGDCTLPEWVA